MGTTLSRKAYAKVNLHLAVGAPYADGYHPIESIFSLVDLSDLLTMKWSRSDSFAIEVSGLEAYCDKGEDTLSKAAWLWYERSLLPLSLHVHCEKHIPVQAGLGGGSSDAAALLHLLQEAAGERALPVSVLQEIALSVGSDVPFFLSGYSCALVEGRGDQVRVLAVEPKHIMIAQPKQYAVSTKEAYARLDALGRYEKKTEGSSIQRLSGMLAEKTSQWNNCFFNDFDRCTDFPEFYDSVVLLANRYAGYGSLSGSGSCWYFVSENDKSVVELSRKLRSRLLDSVQLWCTKLI